MGKRAVGMPRERHKTLLRAFGRLQRNRHMAEPSPTRLFKEPPCAFSTTSLSTGPERATLWPRRTALNPEWPEQPTSKHAEVFSRGFLDFKGDQWQGQRQQPAFIPLRGAFAAPLARDADLLPLQESRAAVLLPSVHGRIPASPIAADAAAPKGVLSSLRHAVLPLGAVPATRCIQRRQSQPRTGDLPGCVLGPRPATVPLHLSRWVRTRLHASACLNAFSPPFFSTSITQNVISNLKYCYISVYRKRQQQTSEQQTHAHSLHQHATFGARARVHFKHVPLQTEAHRDRHVPELVREAGENLVSEPPGEAQKGGQRQRTENWIT